MQDTLNKFADVLGTNITEIKTDIEGIKADVSGKIKYTNFGQTE
jgi:hypothetical protein